jgi:type IV pilus assembly protein PilP
MRFSLIALLIFMAGCEQNEFSDLRTFMAQAGASGQQALEPLPPVKLQDNFTYDPGDIPDPFKPRSMKSAKAGGGLQPDLSRPKEPLEQYPLDALRMVGTMKKSGQIYALVRTPENALYRVKKGDHVGQNYGLVIAINDSNMELREIIQDGVGDWAEAKASLALQE